MNYRCWLKVFIESYLTNDGLIAAIDNQEYNFNYLEKRFMK